VLTTKRRRPPDLKVGEWLAGPGAAGLVFDQGATSSRYGGGPGPGYEGPETESGCPRRNTRANVWIGGQGRRQDAARCSSSSWGTGKFFLCRWDTWARTGGSNDLGEFRGASPRYGRPEDPTRGVHSRRGYATMRVAVARTPMTIPAKDEAHWGAYGNKGPDDRIGKVTIRKRAPPETAIFRNPGATAVGAARNDDFSSTSARSVIPRADRVQRLLQPEAKFVQGSVLCEGKKRWGLRPAWGTNPRSRQDPPQQGFFLPGRTGTNDKNRARGFCARRLEDENCPTSATGGTAPRPGRGSSSAVAQPSRPTRRGKSLLRTATLGRQNGCQRLSTRGMENSQ